MFLQFAVFKALACSTKTLLALRRKTRPPGQLCLVATLSFDGFARECQIGRPSRWPTHGRLFQPNAVAICLSAVSCRLSADRAEHINRDTMQDGEPGSIWLCRLRSLIWCAVGKDLEHMAGLALAWGRGSWGCLPFFRGDLSLLDMSSPSTSTTSVVITDHGRLLLCMQRLTGILLIASGFGLCRSATTANPTHACRRWTCYFENDVVHRWCHIFYFCR
jgi:hypothetical protein